MPVLNVTADQAAQSQSATDEAGQVFLSGAAVGGSPVVDPLPDTTSLPAPLKDFVEAVALGVLRSLPLRPFKLPTYVIGSLPAAGGYEGCLVYLTDTKQLAYSNGTAWLKLTGLP